MKKICQNLLFFYKTNISPILGRSCIYTPTCSMYTNDSIQKYGVFRGIIMGILRILRCNPLAKGGFDPVKENLRGNAKWTL
ncbi:MAG: membrane protein insertion efficiency factor YidD [Clostridia bacterium]